MISADNLEVIDALDLDAIKVKLTHGQSGEGWSVDRANAVEREYKRFLYLMKKFPNEHTSPPVDVDTFWHYHILDTRKYAADCQAVFGYFLHHFPYIGMRGQEDEQAWQRMGQRMRTLYKEAFGQDPSWTVTAGNTSRSAGLPVGTAYGGLVNANAHGVRRHRDTALALATAGSAYCSTTAAEPAYCSATSAEPAYCSAIAAKPAYCSATSAEPAYCSTIAGKPAYCQTTTGLALDCSTINASAYCSTITEEPAYCSMPAPEDRLGFYLERPRLAQA